MNDKVLLLSPFFYPEPISTGKYNTQLAKALSLAGVDVNVFCCHPVYPKWKVEKTEMQLPGIMANRGGHWLKFPKNVLLRRTVLELWFCLFVSFKMFTSGKKYTHVVAIFPPSLFMLIVPLLARKTKLVGIVHDLQGVYANRNAGKIKKAIFAAIKWVERRAFKACDKLIFLSEDMMKATEDEYGLAHDKNVVRYPFITIDNFKNRGDLSSIIPDGQKAIVYSGALGEKQAPQKLAMFMEQFVLKNNDFKAYIFSQGSVFESLKSKYQHICFEPLVAEEDLPELLLRSTIQILPQETGTSDGSLPSKLPNLLASGCKILCITDSGSELVRLLKNYSLAEVNHSWEVEELILQASKLSVKQSIKTSDKSLLNKFTKSALVNSVIN